MKCSNCGGEVSQNANQCPRCNAIFEGDSTFDTALFSNLPFRKIVAAYAIASVVILPIGYMMMRSISLGPFQLNASLPITLGFVVMWLVVLYGVVRSRRWSSSAAAIAFAIIVLMGLVGAPLLGTMGMIAPIDPFGVVIFLFVTDSLGGGVISSLYGAVSLLVYSGLSIILFTLDGSV